MSKPKKVLAGAPDRPLVIGDIEIPCYVLEEEIRVLSQGGFLKALARSRTPKAGTGGVDNPPFFLSANNLSDYISEELWASTTPIPFQSVEGAKAFGYPAILLPQVCEVYLKAREAGVLLSSQIHIAERAEILIRGLATVGVIALVDEATGYQDIRDRNALHKILDRYLMEEKARWAKRFPDEFYSLIFKLKGWPGPIGVKRPSVIGRYTNDIVYERLAPGVLAELKKRNPTAPSGQRRFKHHQFLTEDIGHPALQAHLYGVLALMRSAPTWDAFQRSLQRAFPKLHQTIPLAGC